ncbi:class F sortase [Longispora albida]|uniref:class F sortase n=1 Tax=Longispora albida TaxID=203523 RepID=UPI00036D27E0|nr:class F sortase [Longispora albida]
MIRKRGPHSYLLAGLAGLLVLAGAAVAGIGLGSWAAPAPASPAASSAVRPAAPVFRVPPIKRATPTRVRIPSIGVNAKLIQVGLDKGDVALPPLEKPSLAGWYKPGPAPGELGPSILVGHVSGKKGPAVFYKLGEVKPGATIEVTRADKLTALFRVDGVERFPKAKFPTARVFGEYTGPHLRLITCGGAYVGGALGYADNVVVFASLVGTR